MVNAIPKPIKDLWDEWSIRSALIFSLGLQTFLIFFAPHRKRTSRKFFLSLIWSAYLLADWAANFAVGQISDSQGNDPKPGDPIKNGELLAFWVPFLLLHLGGPDTITALALEDNELWPRHLFGLLCQSVATVYVLLQSLPNALWVPTLLVFATGIIKYAERALALYLASFDKFKDSMIQRADPGPNYAKLMEEYAAMKDKKIPTQIIKIEEHKKDPKAGAKVRPDVLTRLNILQYAYKYFNTFKGLVVDLMFTSQERAESKRYFSSLEAQEALGILEVELNFIYEALYTKAEILHNRTGVIFRFIALGCLLAALIMFQIKSKDDYDGFDVGLTYALLIGGIALDSIALIMFLLSDWTFVRWRKMKDEVDDEDTTFDKFLNWMLAARSLKIEEMFKCCKATKEDTQPQKVDLLKTEKYECFKDTLKKEETEKRNWFKSVWCCKGSKKEVSSEKAADGLSHKVLDTSFFVRRWSEYVHAHNLIEYCLWRKPRRIHHTKGFVLICFNAIIKYSGIGSILKAIGKAIGFCFNTIQIGCRMFYKLINDKIIRICRNRKWLTEDFIWAVIYWICCLYHLAAYVVRKFWNLFEAQIEEGIFTSSDRLTLNLWEHIFKEVKNKAYFADDLEGAKRVSSARGYWALRDIQGGTRDVERREKLSRYVINMDYDQSLLTWHIATELLYRTKRATKENHSSREFSKILSGYMVYLLIMRPTLMSAVAGIGKIRFKDTCEEAKKFFDSRHITDRDVKKASEAILSVANKVKPVDVKGDRSKSVLFDGSMLAKELQFLINEDDDSYMWEVVSKVWVEMLSYAATNCGATEQAAELCKGGQLITFVWLLMAHLGLGDHFQINHGDCRAKLVIGK